MEQYLECRYAWWEDNVERLKMNFFDFEVTPEWWCCVVGYYPEDGNIPESIKQTFEVFTSDEPDVRNKLVACVAKTTHVNMGYNCKYYDNVIMNGVANHFGPRNLKILNDCIIDDLDELKISQLSDEELEWGTREEYYRISPWRKKKYQNFIYQDLMDDNTGSLKEKESCMGLDIRESNVSFNKRNLTDGDKAEIIDYCKHDVWASMQFYKIILEPFVDTKLIVAKVFNLDVKTAYTCTNASLASKVLGAVKRTHGDELRQDIEIQPALRDYIKYSLPRMVIDHVVRNTEKLDVKMFGNVVSFANGGIHSIPCDERGKAINNIKVKSNEEWALVDVDASSFYPAMMIYHNMLSRCVQSPEKFKMMYETRLALKEKANVDKHDKELSQAYKLILNTTSGAAGNKWLPLYDPYMCSKNCRIGQLLITSLANNIYNSIRGTQIVQCNTDGILMYIRRTELPMLREIYKEFTRVTQILIEEQEWEEIYQRDVNNYIMYSTKGKEKSKGGFFVTDMQQPGYNRVRPLDAYVCRNAVKKWLREGKDIVEYIWECTTLSEFCITAHKGSFSGITQMYNDGREPEVLHRCNRVIASTDTTLGEIKKTKRFKGELRYYKCPGVPPHCKLVNEQLDRYDFKSLRDEIDYEWYINETASMLSDQWYEMQADKIIPIRIFEME